MFSFEKKPIRYVFVRFFAKENDHMHMSGRQRHMTLDHL